MATINTYLYFPGNCAEAFDFYKSVFGGEFQFVGKFSDMPPDPEFGLQEGDLDRIMHISLPISKETTLMGSDTTIKSDEKLRSGNNFAISINAPTIEEANRLFNALSEGGKVTMPMEKTFWGAYFGMFTDKFGINWMVNHDVETQS